MPLFFNGNAAFHTFFLNVWIKTFTLENKITKLGFVTDSTVYNNAVVSDLNITVLLPSHFYATLHVNPVQVDVKCIPHRLFFKIQILIAIFGFSMKNAFKWVQTSLVSVQGSWGIPMESEKVVLKFQQAKKQEKLNFPKFLQIHFFFFFFNLLLAQWFLR